MTRTAVTEYYEALKPAYVDALAWAERVRSVKPRLTHRFVVVAQVLAVPLLLLFVLPILPFIATFSTEFAIGPLRGGTRDPVVFLAMWVGGGILLGAVLTGLLWVGKRTEPSLPPPPHSLSAEQMSFVAAFDAADALRQYFVGFVDSHLDRAQGEIERLLKRERWVLPLVHSTGDGSVVMVDGQLVNIRFPETWMSRSPADPSLIPSLQAVQSALRLAERAPWVELGSASRRQMQALLTMPQKLLPRIRQHDDLPKLGEVTEALSEFLFGFLPDHEARLSTSDLTTTRAYGLDALQRLTELLDSLSEIRESPQGPKHGRRPNRIVDLLQSAHPLARFASWGAILLVAATLLGLVADVIWDLSNDTLALLIIPTALLGAATLTVLQASPLFNSRAARVAEADTEPDEEQES